MGGEEEYQSWVPFLGTIFLFIFASNWSGALLPWRVIELSSGELAAPTNDINTWAALALMTSVAYFYAGLRKKGLGYFARYVEPVAFFCQLTYLKILQNLFHLLSVCLEIFQQTSLVGVLLSLVPLFVPVPIMLLGLFTSAIQALV